MSHHNLDSTFNSFTDTSTLNIPISKIDTHQIINTKITPTTTYEHTKHIAVTPLTTHYIPLPLTPPNKKYPFKLDIFQLLAINAIERNESVLVSAHTSSGKTLVAEHAIQQCINNNQRVIYTSPIKALSNQKYRELNEQFKDVGLMTGDVTLNPTASAVVMTTEILRNMLYKGSEILREVRYIIFDEIHYMKDKERGVVWEESIVLLPKYVRMVFLSATIPNALQFAEWITHIHQQSVHVIYTEKRPTPLIHYLAPLGESGMTKVCYQTEEGNNKSTVFDKKAFSLVNKNMIRTKKIENKHISQIIGTLVDNCYLPSIFFSFSRKDCEKYALEIEEDFLNSEEKKMVKIIFENALSTLRAEDRNLPLILNILPLLMKGIGIHHSGLLPLLKEVVEILFQENLLKILFATETFSIGLNMPAKCVIFTSLFKYDGYCKRIVSSGEYIQMSGRAGRRGLDDKGVVIVMLGESIGVEEGCRLFSGECDRLDSAFYLSYNMILNLMRVEGLDPLFLLGRSFFHFQKIQSKKNVEREVEILGKKVKEVENEVCDLWVARERLLVERSVSLQEMFGSYLKVGRLVRCFLPRGGATIFFNAVILGKHINSISVNAFMQNGIKKMQILCTCIDRIYDARVKENYIFNSGKKIPFIGIKSEFDEKIWELEGMMEDLGCRVNTGCYLCGKVEIDSNCLDQICYNPLQDNDSVKEPVTHKNISKNIVSKFSFHEIVSCFRSLFTKDLHTKKIVEYNSLNEIYHMEDCKKMIRVLRRLEYCDINNTVLVKGRVACEISTGDELILTEMIFNGDFISLGVEEIVPLLSCLVFSEWDEENDISDENLKTYRLLKNTVEKICNVMNECGIEIDSEIYLKRFSYELMDVVRMWVVGFTFSEICSKTNIFEGSIIRCFRRLEELMRQLCNAARGIGNGELENIFGIGVTKIKRDIVFANSLYL